ncbi:hypothetical protein PCH_Pc17g00400 [Penicillium rubens Wisconsin 54-1255]|uniref:Uncharacterized protein n=1 Tax=Penicillium rubens (strain ATCC 28089 / DSM 1075 / NRRL 1951 / Wisconsin 54-1255) TaxID=500485 RepID=B6HAX1_PENRW|nr:hypothetical protein PCH_Pc17g00400 [Penicillium rubens Wisconsin 54-1255]
MLLQIVAVKRRHGSQQPSIKIGILQRFLSSLVHRGPASQTVSVGDVVPQQIHCAIQTNRSKIRDLDAEQLDPWTMHPCKGHSSLSSLHPWFRRPEHLTSDSEPMIAYVPECPPPRSSATVSAPRKAMAYALFQTPGFEQCSMP